MVFLTPQELQEKIRFANPFFIANTTITSNEIITIDFSKNGEKTFGFNNVTFTKHLVFTNLDFKSAVSFYSCNFHGGITIINCKIKLYPQPNPHCLFFDNCDFFRNNVRIEKGSVFESSVEIRSAKNLKTIYILDSKLTSFNLKESTISDIHLNNSDFNQELRIEGCTINSQIRQLSNKYGALTWMNSTFKKDVFLKDNEIRHNISIQDNIFEDSIVIDPYSNIIPESTLTIINNQFKRSFTISYFKKFNEQIIEGGPETICIFSNEFDDGLIISGNNTITIKTLGIDISNKFEGLLKISDFLVQHLHLTGENYRGNIILKNLWIKNFEIINYANYSSFQFINCQALNVGSMFKIQESYLEKFQFTNCRLEDFTEYLIESSNLSLIKSSNTQWFNFTQLEKSNIVDYSDINNKHQTKVKKIIKKNENIRIYLELRDIFRQLKYAMEQQGDKVNALTFKSFEMKAYHKYIRLNFNFLHIDRLVLLFGRTNAYGINWIIPIGFILGFTLLFWAVLFFDVSAKYYIGGEKWAGTEFFSDLLHYKKIFPQLLNPIHKVEDVFSNKNFTISGWTYGLDFLYKIIFSFFVFQMVSAFRKFVK